VTAALDREDLGWARFCDDSPMFKRKPVTATVGDRAVRCLICGGEQFWDRDVQLNTSGMEFLGVEWANASATGLICTDCGYVHEFAGDAVQLYKTG
jgi:predicted nucleic-acid-binding Zn-ribbon protein